MHKFRTILSVVATAAMVLGTMGAASAASLTNETRADFIVQLDQSLGIQPVSPTTPNFTDVPSTNADYGYIEAAYQKGFVTGISGDPASNTGVFGPTMPITRAEAAKILVEAYEGGNYTQTETSTTFTDNASIPTALVGYVAEAASLKLMLGFTSGGFGPEAYLTTAQETHLIAQLKAVQAAAGFKVTASSTDVGVGQLVTLSSTAAGTTTYTLSGTNASNALVSGSTFVATAPGNYTVTGTAGDLTATITIGVYGQASGVTLSTSSSPLVADGAATDTITAKVVDANGNVVANFNGNVNVAIPAGAGTFNSGSTTDTITITNGMGTDTLTAPSTNPGTTETITTNTLQPTALTTLNPTYGTLAISYANPVATALSVPSQLPNMAVNSATTDSITVSLLDQAGNSMVGYSPVGLSIAGPATFTSNSSSTFSGYIAGGTLTETISNEVGVTGSIVVTASETGLKSGSATVAAVVATNPAALKVAASTGTTSSGVPYTVYTVSLVDANGNVVTNNSSDNITWKDNASSLGGAITYYTYDSSTGGPTTTTVSGSTGLPLTHGQVTFVAEATTGFSGNATLTLTDATDSNVSTTTATLAYTAGSAASLNMAANNATVSLAPTITSGTYTANQNIPEGSGNYNVFAQLTDLNGNPVNAAGTQVTFSITGTPSLTGVTFVNGATSYTVDTNASGLAEATFSVPSTDGAGNVTIAATFTNSKNVTGNATAIEFTAVPAASYATQVVYASSTGSVNPTSAAGGSTFGLEAYGGNAIGASVTGDEIAFASSNGNAVSLPTTTSAAVLSGTPGYATLAAVSAGVPGTSVVTAQDVSSYAEPSSTESISVSVGVFTTFSAQDSSGNSLTSTSSGVYDTVQAGQEVAITITAGDAAGNITGADAGYTITLPTVAGETYANWRLTQNGGNVTTVTFQPGQAEATVYLLNGSTANNIVVGPAAQTGTFAVNMNAMQVGLTASGTTLSVSPSGPATVATSGTETITATVSGAQQGWTVYFTLNGTGSGTLNATSDVTNANGQASVTYTAPSTGSGSNTVTVTAAKALTSPLTVTTGSISY